MRRCHQLIVLLIALTLVVLSATSPRITNFSTYDPEQYDVSAIIEMQTFFDYRYTFEEYSDDKSIIHRCGGLGAPVHLSGYCVIKQQGLCYTIGRRNGYTRALAYLRCNI